MEISGPTPAGSAAAQAPITLAGKVKAAGTLPSTVDNGDVTHLLTDEYGRVRAVLS